MYPVNADNFGKCDLYQEFFIREIESDALLYAERWSRHILSPLELQKFLEHCEKLVARWNAAIHSLLPIN